MRTVLLLSLIIVSMTSRAQELKVIEDNGKTVNFSDYVLSIPLPSNMNNQQLLNNKKEFINNHPIDKNQLWKVSSNDFKEGRFEDHYWSLSHPNRHAFYIVGNDPYSIEWLKQNKKTLQSLKAVGFFGGDGSMVSIEKIKKETGIMLIPVNLESLEELLGTSRFPLLVKDGWVQQ